MPLLPTLEVDHGETFISDPLYSLIKPELREQYHKANLNTQSSVMIPTMLAMVVSKRMTYLIFILMLSICDGVFFQVQMGHPLNKARDSYLQ